MGKRKRCTSLRENNENSSQLSITEESDDKTTDEIAKRKKAKEETGGNLKRSNAKEELADISVETERVNNVNKTCTDQNAILSTMCLPASPPATCAGPETSSPPRTTLTLRTSARVLNKQRREENKRDEALTNVIQDLTDKDLETDQENERLEGTGGRKKRRRAWELWSMEDKNLFFEAINDCGKDFEAIQNYLTTKMRKKGNTGYTIKNKDQVRHFYYRTWHKISKYITFNEGVKKATQELYGLINFGELRKKSGGQLDEKKGLKLQELIHKGSTTVRIRGKGIRVRTPICRALKKLNQIVEKRDATVQKVPSSVTVELVPGNMAAWCHVQGQAHNPRLRLNSSLQRPLHTLLQHVQEKWRKSHLKLRETLSHRATFPIELSPVKEQVLRLLPPKGVTIKPCSIEADMLLKSSEVSLISHERQLNRCNEKKGGRKKGGKKQQKNSNTASIGSTENLLGEVMDVGSADGYQEELDDCSDVEDPLGVPSPEDEVVFSPEQPISFINISNKVKIERDDLSLSPPQKGSNEELDADVRVKEETDAESGDVLRQLLALERVAGAGDDYDSEVQYIGESTRLTSASLEASGRFAAGDEPEAATTPEPPEEDDDEDGIAHYQTQADIDVEAQLIKIRAGWTLECVSNITIGELYLMFGQNKKLTLEYEFEDPNSKKEECLKSPRTPSLNTFESPVRPSNNANEQRIENTDLCQELENSNEAITNFDTINHTSNEEVNIGEANVDPSNNVSAIDKREAVENLSGMLQQLLGMARTIFSKPGGLYEQPCSCGHVCPQSPGGPISGLRSPAGSRCQNLLNGVGRSPCSTRSPRNSRLIVDGFLSPKASLSDYRGRSPLTTKQKRDTRKPASAKRLIPDLPDTQTHQTRERLKSISGSDIITDLIDGPMRNQVSADMRIQDLAEPQLVNSSNPQVSMMNITSNIGSMITTSSSIDNILVNATSLDTLPGSRGQISTVTSQASTIGQSQASAVIGTTPVSIAGMSIVVGNDHAGEFRIPTAPAPRQMQSQASFNAQLNRLLPRYNKRPGRRIMRNKNVVIQRQLPLLPKMPPRPPSLVTLNVLSQGGQGGSGGNFVPISPSSTTSNPRGPNIHRMPLASAFPQNMMNIRQVIPGMQMMQQLHPGQAVGHVSQTLQVTDPAAHTVQTAVPVSHTVQNTGHVLEQQLPMIRSAATPQQQTIVSGQTTGTSVLVSSTQANLSSGNSISINVSGQPMLTMRMPANTSASTSMIQDVASVIQTSGATMINDIIVNNMENNSTISDQHISSRSMNGIFKDMVSEALSELPDLSTPPGTPRPSSSCSTPMNTPNHKAAGLSGSHHHDLTISPSSLFNASFTLDSGTPSLYGNLPDPNTTSSADDASTNFNQLTSSPVSLLTASNTRYLSELSPPHAGSTNELASLLNTPTPHQASSSTINTPRRETSPPPHNTSLSALLSSASPDLAKGFPLILGGSNSQHQDFTDSQPSSSAMPELHLSDSVNLPMLDISIGGTVSINDDPQSIHSEKRSVDQNILSSIVSNSNVPTSTASIMQMDTMRETNTEKLLDITLGISNSNSSFSSLLAAATQPRAEDEMIDSSFLRHSSLNNSVVGFPGLSGTNHPSPPSSPSRLLQHEDENHWLNNEVNDYSLSSLLGHFDSPAKGGSSKNNNSQSSSTNVSGNGQENTVDFTSKFAEMKEQVARNLNN